MRHHNRFQSALGRAAVPAERGEISYDATDFVESACRDGDGPDCKPGSPGSRSARASESAATGAGADPRLVRHLCRPRGRLWLGQTELLELRSVLRLQRKIRILLRQGLRP